MNNFDKINSLQNGDFILIQKFGDNPNVEDYRIYAIFESWDTIDGDLDSITVNLHIEYNSNTEVLSASKKPRIISKLDTIIVMPRPTREKFLGLLIKHNYSWNDRIKHIVPYSNSVNHPARYTSDPSGVECIQITRHRNFNVGNAIKYLWRAGLKEDPALDRKAKTIEDLQKAVFYITDEITRLQNLK